jgi:hypothetical protein
MSVTYFLVFIVVWVAGCAVADLVIGLGDDGWRMAFGALVYMVADGIGEEIERRGKA